MATTGLRSLTYLAKKSGHLPYRRHPGDTYLPSFFATGCMPVGDIVDRLTPYSIQLERTIAKPMSRHSWEPYFYFIGLAGVQCSTNSRLHYHLGTCNLRVFVPNVWIKRRNFCIEVFLNVNVNTVRLQHIARYLHPHSAYMWFLVHKSWIEEHVGKGWTVFVQRLNAFLSSTTGITSQMQRRHPLVPRPVIYHGRAKWLSISNLL